MKHKITHLIVDHDPFTVRFMCNGLYLRHEFAFPLTELEIERCYPYLDWSQGLCDNTKLRYQDTELSNTFVLDGFMIYPNASWVEIPYSKDLQGHK